ncbi:MAG: nitronate monooxygenase [Gaiellaceae bacterium]
MMRGLARPVVLAPLAGGPATPALAAAVCEAGGLGFLAAGYLSPEQLEDDIRELRQRTPAPFGVNVFVPGQADVDDEAVGAYVERLEAEAMRYATTVGEARFDDDGWTAKLRVVREARVPVVSFTFGCPGRDVVSELKAAGSEVWVTVTRDEEARVAEAAGADALVVQGSEAGGHRGSFVDDDVSVPLLDLLRAIAAVSTLPLIATGGLGDKAAVTSALAAGASAAQMGTAFLRAPEAGTNAAHRKALATDGPTAFTRAFTGRLARGLVNRFMREHDAYAPSAYPHVHFATASIRAAARERLDADGFNLWAGEAHALAEELPAAEIVAKLV